MAGGCGYKYRPICNCFTTRFLKCKFLETDYFDKNDQRVKINNTICLHHYYKVKTPTVIKNYICVSE